MAWSFHRRSCTLHLQRMFGGFSSRILNCVKSRYFQTRYSTSLTQNPQFSLGSVCRKGRDGKTTLRFRRIREWQMPAFRESYDAPSSRIVEQSRFNSDVRWDMRVPDLEEVWLALADNPKANDFATFGQGLAYHGKYLPPGVATYSEDRFPGAKRGFVRFEPLGLQLHQLPKLYWMNLADEALRRRRAGTTVGIPQVLLNYARVSRGPWRLKALIDRVGRPVASRFIAARPRSIATLELLWALLNSPSRMHMRFVISENAITSLEISGRSPCRDARQLR